MNKRILLWIALILGYAGVNAQVGFKADVRLGFSFSQVDGDHFSGYNKAGANFGLAISVPVKENYQLGFELLYAQKGSKLKVDPDDPQARIFILQYDYLEIPIVFRREAENWLLEGALSYGVAVRRLQDEGAGFRETPINPTEVSYLFGAGYKISEKSALVLRHQQSLLRVGNNYPNGLNIWNRIGLYNRGFVVHYRYSL